MRRSWRALSIVGPYGHILTASGSFGAWCGGGAAFCSFCSARGSWHGWKRRHLWPRLQFPARTYWWQTVAKAVQPWGHSRPLFRYLQVRTIVSTTNIQVCWNLKYYPAEPFNEHCMCCELKAQEESTRCVVQLSNQIVWHNVNTLSLRLHWPFFQKTYRESQKMHVDTLAALKCEWEYEFWASHDLVIYLECTALFWSNSKHQMCFLLYSMLVWSSLI